MQKSEDEITCMICMAGVLMVVRESGPRDYLDGVIQDHTLKMSFLKCCFFFLTCSFLKLSSKADVPPSASYDSVHA